MELNIDIFKNYDESNYFLLRTKNYHKTNLKYSKKRPLLNMLKVFRIDRGDPEYYNTMFDKIIKSIDVDEKLFIVCMNFHNNNLIFVFTGLDNIDNKIFKKFITSNDLFYRKNRLKLLPIVKSESKILKLVCKDNRPIIIGRKTETYYTNCDRYFRIEINLYKSLLIRAVINKIVKNCKNLSLSFGLTIETKKEDKTNEDLFAVINIDDLSRVIN